MMVMHRRTTFGVPFGGCERLHRQCVNFLTHTVAQRAIDNLVALDARLAFECASHNHGLKVRAIAIDGEVFAIELGAEITFNVFGRDHEYLLPQFVA